MVEASELDLDARIPQQPFTLRQLLQHTSGLPDYTTLRDYQMAVDRRDKPWSRRKLLDATLAQGMLFEPNAGWSYSNVGYLFARELIEETAGKPIGDVITDFISRPLGLATVELWNDPEQSALLVRDKIKGYNPGWVYHGCLIGSVSDSARLLQAVFNGSLLCKKTLTRMLDRRAISGPIPERPWINCGYALGLMYGEMRGVGRAIGHSGGGPSTVNAIYHFPDLTQQPTVACFADGKLESVPEFAAARIALNT